MTNPNPLNQFKKGKSGNPKGRPRREWTWAGLLEDACNAVEKGDAKSVKEHIVEKVTQLARRGDMTAAKEVFNRMDGMPKQSTDLTSDGKEIKGVVILPSLDETKDSD